MIRELETCCIEVELDTICKNSTHIYYVTLIEGEWPVDYDLVTICDGGDPERTWSEQMHGGGWVESDSAIVKKVTVLPR